MDRRPVRCPGSAAHACARTGTLRRYKWLHKMLCLAGRGTLGVEPGGSGLPLALFLGNSARPRVAEFLDPV